MGRKQVGIFLASFAIAFLFFGAVNFLEQNLKEFFLWKEQSQLAGLYSEPFWELKPWRNWEVGILEIEAQSAIAVFEDSKGQEFILFHKNSQTQRPIASLTKLMTGLLVREMYDLEKVLQIQKILPEDNGSIQRGHSFKVKDLLLFSLVASNNTAAEALALASEKDFVSLMNNRALALGMLKTNFVNATGLDPDVVGGKLNVSTAQDLVKLAKAISKDSVLLSALQTKEIILQDQNNLASYKIENTNKLLGSIPELLGGKTGTTPLAQKNFLGIFQAPKNKGKIYTVVLGTLGDPLQETRKLFEWVKKAYIF